MAIRVLKASPPVLRSMGGVMVGTFWRLLLCAVSVLGANVQSKANSLPPLQAIGGLSVCPSNSSSCSSGTTINSTTPNLSGTYTSMGGTASGAISLNQSLTATAQTTLAGVVAESLTQLYYYVEVVSSPQATTPVPVTVQASGSVSPGYSQGNSVVLQLASLINILCNPSCTGGAKDSFSLNTTVNLLPNTAYNVRLQTNVEAYTNGSNGSSASATLDPFFQFASGFDSAGYSLAFSPGIVNTMPVAATPLPPALSLFAGGLGVFGLLGWRKRRKTALLAA